MHRLLKTASFVVLAASAVANIAYAIEAKSAAYYCISEAAGGVAYEERLKKWTSTHFRPGKGFVLKLNFLSTNREKMFDWTDISTVNRFIVTVTEAGSSLESPCRNLKDYRSPVEFWDDGWLRCEAGLSEFRFNPVNNRFLKAYLVGYVGGDNDNENTPAITIGVCTKIS